MTEHVAAQGKKAAAPAAPPVIDKERIREHVKYLSSDAMEGRGTGQRGGDLAADYIAKTICFLRLEARGDNGTFFQSVPMVAVGTLRRRISVSANRAVNRSKRKTSRIL